jgi:aminoglycoside phosphotransferase
VSYFGRLLPSEGLCVSARAPHTGRTLAAVQRATNTDAARAVVAQAIDGTGWSIARVRREGVRLEPPLAYWATYRVRIERLVRGQSDPQERRLVLVARACFGEDDWRSYAGWLRELYADAPCRPVDGLGHPVLVDAEQLAWWFFPVDPQLPTLAAATDARVVRRLLAPRYSPKTPPARIAIDTVRYLPEISAALRYRIVDKPGAAERLVFGKLYRGDRGRELHETTLQLQALSRQRPELLSVVEPIGYDEELALHLEHAVPGTPVGSDRKDPVFLAAAVAAAEALAVLHDSGLASGSELPLAPEVDRLDEVTHQMSLVHPDAGRLLRDLVVQLRSRLSRTAEEDWVFTHGDMKYDQFIEHGGRFTLVDFEEVGRSETSWDLGKWCAHAVPSMPETWEDSDGAEQARAAFLRRYLELRPTATRGRFPHYEAIHLANRAMVLMWGQTDGWEGAAESLLTLAMERLQTPAP